MRGFRGFFTVNRMSIRACVSVTPVTQKSGNSPIVGLPKSKLFFLKCDMLPNAMECFVVAEQSSTVAKWLPTICGTFHWQHSFGSKYMEHSIGSILGTLPQEATAVSVRCQTPSWPPEQIREWGVWRQWEGVDLVEITHAGSYPFHQQPPQPSFLLRIAPAVPAVGTGPRGPIAEQKANGRVRGFKSPFASKASLSFPTTGEMLLFGVAAPVKGRKG